MNRLAALARHVAGGAAAAAGAVDYPPLDIPDADASSKVIFLKKGGVAYVVINRPEVLNACDDETYARLEEIWHEFEHDDTLRVAILTGAGPRALSAGSDIKSNYHEEFEAEGEKLYGRDVDDTLPRTSMMRPGPKGKYPDGGSVTKPVICGINGHANGGGMEQALACDIRVAAEHAQFGMGEVRLGWLPGGGGTQRLPRLIPQGRAMEMLMTGNRIGAQEALRLGVVDHGTVTAAALLPGSLSMAKKKLLRQSCLSSSYWPSVRPSLKRSACRHPSRCNGSRRWSWLG